jgi:integrase
MAERTTFNPFAPKPPDRDRVFLADPECRGHHVCIFASGERVSYFKRKVAGAVVKGALGVLDKSIPASREIPQGVDPLAYIGTRPSLNLGMARTLARNVGVLVDRGVNPFKNVREQRTAREGELTLEAAFDLYERDYLLPKGKRRATDLRQMFERYLGAISTKDAKKKHGRERTKSPHGVDWSTKRLSQVTEADARRLMNRLAEGHSAYVANRVGELARALFNKMIAWKATTCFAGPNPFEGIDWFDEHSRERFVRAEEAPAFFAALNAVPSGSFKDFVCLALFTGARRNNVLAMRWDAVDMAAATWTIPGQSSKNKQPLVVPLTERAVELLRVRRAGDPEGTFVFPAASKTGHMTPPKKQWRALLTAAKLDDLRLHDLRRSLGSWAINTGASLAIVGKALGHRSPEATKVYARLQVDPVRDAMQRAQDAMMAAATAPTPAQPPAAVIPIRKRTKATKA